MQVEWKWCNGLNRDNFMHKFYTTHNLWEEAPFPSLYYILCLSTRTTSICHFSLGLPNGNPKTTSKGFMVENKIPNVTPVFSFDHNSCKSSLNEQCKGILSIYASKPFQWCLGDSIWCLFSFPTKNLNIHNSHMNITPKMEVHLGIIRLHPLHSPPIVKVCFTPKHTLLASWVLALHT